MGGPFSRSAKPQFVELLEVEPELPGSAQEALEAQSRVAGDGAPGVENLGDAVHRYLDAGRKLGRSHAERREVLAERLARVDGLADGPVRPHWG